MGERVSSKSEKITWNKVFMMFPVPIKHFPFSGLINILRYQLSAMLSTT